MAELRDQISLEHSFRRAIRVLLSFYDIMKLILVLLGLRELFDAWWSGDGWSYQSDFFIFDGLFRAFRDLLGGLAAIYNRGIPPWLAMEVRPKFGDHSRFEADLGTIYMLSSDIIYLFANTYIRMELFMNYIWSSVWLTLLMGSVYLLRIAWSMMPSIGKLKVF